MALDPTWEQQLLKYEVTLAPPPDNQKSIGRTLVDGTLIVYDLDDEPGWLSDLLGRQDEDGNVERQVTPAN